MNIIHTIHVKTEITNQHELVSCYQLLDSQAKNKGLLLYAMPQGFEIAKQGNPVSKECLFRTQELDAVKQFIDTHKQEVKLKSIK
jgi:hypothetical protein